MRKLLFIIVFTVFSVIVFSISFSNFSDTETSNKNSFTAASNFNIAPTPSTTGAIKINEVYFHGNHTKEWVELYNPLSYPVDLKGWSITDNNTTIKIATSTSFILKPKSFGVIVAKNNSIILPPECLKIELTYEKIGNGLNDSGDRIILSDDLNEIDAMSYGTDDKFFTLPVPSNMNNKSLERKIDGEDTNTASDWQIASPPTLCISNN